MNTLSIDINSALDYFFLGLFIAILISGFGGYFIQKMRDKKREKRDDN